MRLAILCSGQAGQRRDMLDELLKAPECAAIRDAASSVLNQDVAVWWNGLSENEIFDNANAQFSIAYFQIATWTRIARILPKPDLIAGYSLGELISFFIAGALNAEETFRLVQARARLMDEAMIGIRGGDCMALWRGQVSPATLSARNNAIARHDLDIAIVRRTGEEVLAGHADDIKRFCSELKFMNPNLLKLPVRIPSHSRHLNSAAKSFRDLLNASSIAAPRTTLLGTVLATPVHTRAEAIDALSMQLAHTIRWDRCMNAATEFGIDTAIEIGPGNDLARLIGTMHPGIRARSIEDFGDYRALAEWVAPHQGETR
jgi:[acyl-carrier-protein] S-malonyltransferase